MSEARDRRVIVAIGVSIVIAVIVAVVLSRRQYRDADQGAAPSQGGLNVQIGRDDDIKFDISRPLQCFAGGKDVGDLTLAQCARRNGVSEGAMDVGLDAAAVVTAPEASDGPFAPPPPPNASGPRLPGTPQAAADVQSALSDNAVCWRYAAGGWRTVAPSASLEACVRALFAGDCSPPGAPPEFGRWGDHALRRWRGEVEISDDDRNYRGLAEQASDCSLPPISTAQ